MIIHADSLIGLKQFPDNHFDSVVTDPPYGLKFMGKKWDYDVPSVELWREVLRVLKPGGHALMACGTRTQHRMAVNIEDAGFEIRDVVTWLYGSGFPKSHDISKAIDREAGVAAEDRPIIGKNPSKRPNAYVGQNGWETPQRPEHKHGPSTDAAKQWAGWGSALKPACEFWTLCRKPIEGTLAQNTLKWGCGGLNIDAGRIEAADQALLDAAVKRMTGNAVRGNATDNFVSGSKSIQPNSAQGRFPANLILDEAAAELLDAQSGTLKNGGQNKTSVKGKGMFPGEGGASRFFYVAKAASKERYSYVTCNCKTVKPSVWVFEGQNQKEKTDFTLLQRDICEKLSGENSNLGISSNGNELTGRFRTECKSITETETRSTIQSKTCNSLLQQNTSESIPDANSEMANGLSPANSAERANESIQPIGISQERAGQCMGAAVPATSVELLRKSVCGDCGQKLKTDGHPTQKPIKLMEYLIKLITPPGGIVLDPFCGSGSTGVAAKKLGFGFVGIERENEYVEIAERRLKAAE